MVPLKLYWWNDSPNFGDVLSSHILENVSNRPVEHAVAREADVFGIGSIMRTVRGATASPRATGRPVVWGSGMMGPQRTDFIDHVQFAAVRGPLTCSLLGIDQSTPQGDPGILASDLFDVPLERHDKIGLVLHHTQKLSSDLDAQLEKDGRFIRINPTDDCLSVVRAIGSCRHVMSSSLHGLIVADSFGVHSTWLDVHKIHRNPTFKFYDYALSVDRLIGRPAPISAVFEIADGLALQQRTLPHEAGVERARVAIRSAFPEELRSGYGRDVTAGEKAQGQVLQ